MSNYNECAIGAIEGHCNSDTISYIQSANDQQYSTVCSASRVIINISYMCIIYMLLLTIL
jgi:hypothetical protein